MNKKINIKKILDRPTLGIILLATSAALLTVTSIFNTKSNIFRIIAMLATVCGIAHIIWHIRNKSKY